MSSLYIYYYKHTYQIYMGELLKKRCEFDGVTICTDEIMKRSVRHHEQHVTIRTDSNWSFLLFHFVSFCFILFHFVSFCFILFHFVSVCFILFHFVSSVWMLCQKYADENIPIKPIQCSLLSITNTPIKQTNLSNIKNKPVKNTYRKVRYR